MGTARIFFNLIIQVFIVFTLSALAACAGGNGAVDRAEASRSDCIYQPSIRGYTVLDESNLIVSTSGRRQYHIGLQRRAHGLRSSWSVAFKSPTGRICSAFSEVVFDGQFNGESIRIASVRELSDEDKEDLLIRYGRKEPKMEQTPAPQDIKGAEVEELDPVADDTMSGD